MKDAYVISKITSPSLHPAILHREALIAKFNDAIIEPSSEMPPDFFSYRLVLLSAPAGYGKTTLLADFANHTTIPCCWYFLDHADTDKITFLQFLLASIRYQFPRFGKSLDSLFSSTIPLVADATQSHYEVETLIDALVAAIATDISSRFMIFLCNYHEINNSDSINNIVNRFLQKLTPQCMLVIESRSIPRLEYAPLAASGKLLGIGSTALRFTAQEIRALSLIQGDAPLNEKEAEQLMISFDGWIIGILLGTRLGTRLLHANILADAQWQSSMPQGDQKYLFDYVVNEVFSREPDLYAFLKEVSILQHMIPAICNELLNVTYAADYLHRLEQQGLFVVLSCSAPDTIYTTHPVLRELFYTDLCRRSSERFFQLHQRAATLFYTSRNYDQAIYHAFASHEWDLAKQIILEAHELMIIQGHGETLARWIDTIPHAITILHPKLLLIRARLYIIFGEHASVLPLLDEVATIVASSQHTTNTDDLAVWQVELAILRSKVLFLQGNYLQAQTLSQHILANMTVDNEVLRAEIYTRLGMCANLLGDFHAGISQLQEALHLLGRNTKMRQTADLHGALASAYSLVGNFALAEHHLSRAIDYWEHLCDRRGKIDSLIRMGLIKQYQGDFLDAESIFQQALTESEAICYQRGEAYTLVNLGELYQDQGLYDQSVTFIDNGLAIAHQIEDKHLINYALCILALVHMFTGDLTTAHLIISQADVQTVSSKPTSYEEILWVLTYGTILLYEGYYDEAIMQLGPLEDSLQIMGLKREFLQVTLRVAACQLALGNDTELLQRLNTITIWMTRGHYKQCCIIELGRLSSLKHFVQKQQIMAHLRTLLHLEGEIVETGDQLPESPLPLHILSPTPTSPTSHRPKLSIQAFGEPVIFLNGIRITRWRVARIVELCFFLLHSGRPMHKEQIINALWPNADDQLDPDHTLRTYIYHLRKTLGGNCIVYQAGTYMLALSSLYDLEYDVAIFLEHYVNAKKALEADDIPTAKDAFLKMVDLYQGNYLQSFYSDWCIPQRDKLRQIYLEARHFLACIAWEQEQFDEALNHWQHMLTIDNCLEEAHYGLMRCFLRQGKRGLALRQYQYCVKVLQDELQINPGSAIQKLYQKMMTSS